MYKCNHVAMLLPGEHKGHKGSTKNFIQHLHNYYPLTLFTET